MKAPAVQPTLEAKNVAGTKQQPAANVSELGTSAFVLTQRVSGHQPH